MAKTPATVRKLLMEVWAPARVRAGEERDQLQEAARAEGGNFKLAAWDWRYYAEKVRKARYDVDDGEIKPYLQLDNVIAAAFDTAGSCSGSSFKERKDLPVYHPDVRVFEVMTAGQAHRAVPRRLFRPALEALGRLDVRLPQAGEARRARFAPSSSTS